jgi:hypothetical protein
MRELFDRLEKRERQVLVLLCVLLTVSLIFHSAVALRQKKVYFRSAEFLPSQQKEFEKAKEANREMKREWLKWAEARQDIKEIERAYFYTEDVNINELRLDLQKIFEKANVRIISDLIFDYQELEGEDLKKVRVSFATSGPYAALKRLIHQVEIHPKFLMIERIDFRDIDTQAGRIELNIVLAGYL